MSETDRQTTEGLRQRDRQMERQTERQTDGETDRQTDRQTLAGEKETDDRGIETDRQTDRQTDGEKETDIRGPLASICTAVKRFTFV